MNTHMTLRKLRARYLSVAARVNRLTVIYPGDPLLDAYMDAKRALQAALERERVA